MTDAIALGLSWDLYNSTLNVRTFKHNTFSPYVNCICFKAQNSPMITEYRLSDLLKCDLILKFK